MATSHFVHSIKRPHRHFSLPCSNLNLEKSKVNYRVIGALQYTAVSLNPLTPNDPYRGRTAPLTSKCCILHIYSTNVGTEYFKHSIYSPFFSFQNAVCFIILTYLVAVLFTFYVQSVLKFKKK